MTVVFFPPTLLSYRHVWLGPRQEPRRFDDAAHRVWPFARVEMDAPDSGKRPQRLHHLDRDQGALSLRVGRFLHPVEDLGAQLEAGHLREPFGLLGRAQHQHASDDRNLASTAAADLDEPPTERREVEHRLRLQEFGTRRDLLKRLREVRLHGLRERGGRRADQHLRGLLDLVAGQEARLIAHPHGHLQEADPVEVLDIHRVRVIPLLRIVPAHEDEVLYADRHRAEHIGLQRDPIPIAASDLHDRLDAGRPNDRGGRDRGHRHHRAVAVGDVDRVDDALQRLAAPADDVRRGAFGRVQLGRDDELARSQQARERTQRKRPLLFCERSSSSVEPPIFPLGPLPLGSELAPQRVSAGCRGVIGPFPQPLWMKGVAYEVSKDASTYTSPAFACPIGSSNGRCAPSATSSPPTRRYRAAGARRLMPVRWERRSLRWSPGLRARKRAPSECARSQTKWTGCARISSDSWTKTAPHMPKWPT